MIKKALSIFVAILICSGCDRSTQRNKSIYIYFNPSEDLEIMKYHIRLSVSNKAILDTIMLRTPIYEFKLLKKVNIDILSDSILTYQINNKTKQINIASISFDTAYVEARYNRSKLRQLYFNYNIQPHPKLSSYKSFLDSLQKHDKTFALDKYDSLKIYIRATKP